MIAAALAALTASGSVYEACSADINMGGNTIKDASMCVLSTKSEVATKDYVDNLMAGSTLLKLSTISTSKGNMGAATWYCAGLTDDTTERPWRLPTLSELVLAASSNALSDGDGYQDAKLWTRTHPTPTFFDLIMKTKDELEEFKAQSEEERIERYFEDHNHWVTINLSTMKRTYETGQNNNKAVCVR